ncbi:MAG: hypothetical protein K6F86_10620 [Lachnospiraceae bacterium]|nr:hypothetical protein [Lachnospiraceae bacterium]
MEFSYAGKESIQLKNIHIRSDRLLFTDSLFCGLSLIIILSLLFLGIIKRKFPSAAVICLIFSVLTVSFPLLSGTYPGGFDMLFHLMRMEGIRDGLLEGQFPVFIFPAAKYGHGYLGALYPSLFMYIPAILRFAGLSEPAAFNAFLILINVLTAFLAYISVKGITGSKEAALFGSVLYCLLPFRIYNLYTGCEVGALLGMAFYPLAVWGIYELVLGESGKWPILTLAFTGMTESHVLSTLFMTVFCAAFCLFFADRFLKEKKRFTALIRAAAWCVVINLFYLVPFFYYQRGLRYKEVLGDRGPVNFMLSFTELFRISPLDTLRPTAGPVLLFLLMTTAVFFSYNLRSGLVKQDNIYFCRFMPFITLFSIGSLLFVTPVFPWGAIFKIDRLYKAVSIIQFPWRLLELAGVLAVVAAAVSLINCDLIRKYSAVFISILIISALMSDFCIIRDQFQDLPDNDQKLSGSYNDDNYNDEYTPHNYISDEAIADDYVPVTSQGITVTDYRKNGTAVSFTYSADSNGSVRIPLIFYQSYRAKTQGGIDLPLYESELGTIQIDLPKTDNDTVFLKHKNPWFITLSVCLSIAALIVFLWRFFIFKGKKMQR